MVGWFIKETSDEIVIVSVYENYFKYKYRDSVCRL